MQREKKTLGKRFRKMLTRPLHKKPKAPRRYAESDLVDLVEFTGLERDAVLAYLERREGRRISDEFAWVAPTSGAQYAWFYRGSRSYLFAASDPWERALELAKPGMRCLDFGGGGGRNALGMAALGCKVFYVDIGLQTSAFVTFRARKRGLDLTVIDPMVCDGDRWRCDTAEAARRIGGFDLIVCDNVFEHVPDYHLVLRKLCAGLEPGGRLLECTPFKREKVYLFKKTPEWDVHLLPRVGMQDAMAAAGMREVGDGLWERTPASSAGVAAPSTSREISRHLSR
jgi:2-polyprenyl-3-methyl-5-hydroxy-6-metoxy-1,4-benzoquinol methylase